MTIFAKLGLGFAAVLTMFVITGALIVWNVRVLRATDEHVRDRIAVNEIALEYRHAALDAALGASQLAQGNPMGEQRIREGTAMARRSRELLLRRLSGEEDRARLVELERVEKLTLAATERVVAHVRDKSSPRVVRQELAFLSARADALNIGLEALYDETREEVASSLAFAGEIERGVQTRTIAALFVCVLASTLVSIAVFRNIKEMTIGLRRAMSALDVRNQEMRVVLDHVSQGLLTMRWDGTVSPERSAVADAWLGPIAPEMPLWGHLQGVDPILAGSLQVGWETVMEEEMPLEVSLEQLPRSAVLGGRHLELEYRPIFQGDQVDKLLVVISDVSDRIAGEEARAKEQETMAIFQAIQRDKQGFLDFVAESTHAVDSLREEGASASLATLKRRIHTLKGNAGIFGIGSVARACHALETAMAEEDRGPTPAEIASLEASWNRLGAAVAEMVGDSRTRIEIDDDEYASILEALVHGRPRREIAKMVAQWRMERVEHRLRRFADQARALAERLDKGVLEVKVEHNGIRLPRDTFASFWGVFVHALRNAVDHGIEPADERLDQGKESPAITLRTRILGEELCVDVADNGRGIDWARIADKARQRGLPAATEEDLVQALFADGVSTTDAVSEVSGRGVGMAALRETCARMAGRIVIRSTPGAGTEMSFRFPRQLMSDATVVELASRPFTRSLAPPSAWVDEGRVAAT